MLDHKRRLVQTCNLSNEYFMGQAKRRWLRPSEICEILRNHNRFNLTVNPPHKPPSGSLLLFDRKVLRYFRKDGHCWRKKKDGRTVREAHEKLKTGNVDVLHCYYAHGEDNKNFHRRTYWLLEEELENIVLVHYRDLSEESRILADTDPTTVSQGACTSCAGCATLSGSSGYIIQESYPLSPRTVECARTPSEFEDTNLGDECGVVADSSSFPPFSQNDMIEISTAEHSGLVDIKILNNYCTSSASQMTFQNLEQGEGYQNITGASQRPGLFDGANFSHYAVPSSMWSDMLGSNQGTGGMHDTTSFEQAYCPDAVRTIDSLVNNAVDVGFPLPGEFNVSPSAHSQSVTGEGKAELQVGVKDLVITQEKVEYNLYASSVLGGKTTMDEPSHAYHMPNDHHFCREPQFNNDNMFQANILATDQPMEYKTEVSLVPKNAMENEKHPHELGKLIKLDSFGRWMDKEIGKDCDGSLMTCGSYWNGIETESGDKEVTRLSHLMDSGLDGVGPSLQEQLYSILDFSPDWAFSGVETKVLISGRFLGNLNPANFKWCCMFGENEVPAELLSTNVIQCRAPAHAPGQVPFYITRSDRSACSEVREFEYREYLHGGTSSSTPRSVQEDDIHFQVRFAKMMSLRADRKLQACSVKDCQKCNLEKNLFAMLSDDVTEWDKIEKDYQTLQGYNRSPKDELVQQMLKERLYKWLVYRTHEEGGLNVLDEKGQGVIHLAAALGYQWAIRPIVTAGVSLNFRDALGRTGLHWAAYYGREETVLELVKLGADPSAVEDPTSKVPEGQTAADLAWIRGHKGIAGYLAEFDLTSHLSKLALGKSVSETVSTNLAKDVSETSQWHKTQPLDGDEGDQSVPSRLLVALRNSDLAAGCIQAALISLWHKRRLKRSNDETSEIRNEALVVSSLNNQYHRLHHFHDYLHTVVSKGQQKHPGHQGKKEFLKPHTRENQVRKPYEKIIWSVSFMEKAILRWRRKRSGLRGFKSAKGTCFGGQEAGESDEYQFLALSHQQKAAHVVKALGRVQSMALQPDAHEQYMRLAKSSHQTELVDEFCASGSRSNSSRGSEG